MSRCTEAQTCKCGGCAPRVINERFSVAAFPGSTKYAKIMNFPPGTDYTDRKESRGDGSWE
jgi:hypothetical protein